MDTDNSMLITRGKVGMGGSRKEQGGQMVMEEDVTWRSKHTIQYTDDVL